MPLTRGGLLSTLRREGFNTASRPAAPLPAHLAAAPAPPVNPTANRAYRAAQYARQAALKAMAAKPAPKQSRASAAPRTGAADSAAAAAGRSPRQDAQMTYDAATGQLLLFGGTIDVSVNGVKATAAAQDTWSWSGGAWTQLSPANSPPPLTGRSMVYDAAMGEVLLFGGGPCNPTCHETWVWDGSNWNQLNPAHSPPNLGGMAMAYDAANGTVVVFGGDCFNTTDPRCDQVQVSHGTWIWNGSDWNMASPAASPGGADFGPDAMTYDPNLGMVLFDDASAASVTGASSQPLGTWAWNGSTWTMLASAAGIPPPSGAQCCSALGEGIVYDPTVNADVDHVWGDIGDGVTRVPQTWAFSGQQWTQLFVSESPAHIITSVAFDAAANLVVQFGGVTIADVNTLTNDLRRLTSSKNGAGATVGYAYDLKGQVTTITYPGGTNQVTRTYDGAGRLASVKDWLGNTVTFSYDADSDLAGATYPGGVRRSLAYDGLDRLLQIP